MAAILLAGCGMSIALTDRGTRVREVAGTELPGGCELLGDVAVGVPPDAARPRTEEQLVILLRNKAAELGGTHVMVESRERREGAGPDPYYLGRGRAYACPDEPEPEPAAPSDESEPSAGGDGESAEDEETPGDL